MKWRRLAEMMGLRQAVRLMDDRERKRRQLDTLQSEADRVSDHVREIRTEAKLESYRRTRVK